MLIGPGFEPRPYQDSGSLNNWEESAAFVMTSANGYSSQSSRIRTKNRRSRLTALSLIWFLWDVKEPTPLFEKSRGRTRRWCGQPSHSIRIMGWVGTVSSQMDWERLPVVPLYADVRAYCSDVNLFCKDGTSVVLPSMTPSFFPKLAMLRSYAVKLVWYGTCSSCKENQLRRKRQ